MTGRSMWTAIGLGLSACGRVGFDAAALDGATDGAPACTAVFCDGFEDPALAAWDGTELAGTSTVERVVDFGQTGASLRANGASGSDVAAIYVDAFPLVPPSDEWVRIQIFSESSGTLDVEPVTLANAARNNEVVFSLYADSVDIHAHGMAGGFNTTTMIPPPRGVWVCYVLHVAISATGSVELYRDGDLIATGTGIDTRPPAGNLARLLVGITSKPTDPTETLFVDQVVADTAPLACN